MMQYLVESRVDMLYIQNNVIYKINKNIENKSIKQSF